MDKMNMPACYEQIRDRINEKNNIRIEPKEKKTTMSVPEMRRLLGVKKTESYWLVHKQYFKTFLVGGEMRVDLESFEKWYANQVKHKKVTGEEPGLELKARSYSAKEMAELLGIGEWTVYEIWRVNKLPVIYCDYWKRLPKEEFERWYRSQSKFRTAEDRLRDSEIESNSVSMPEMARLLGVTRGCVYSILRSQKYQDLFEIVWIADRKRIMLRSLARFLEVQNTYRLADPHRSLRPDGTWEIRELEPELRKDEKPAEIMDLNDVAEPVESVDLDDAEEPAEIADLDDAEDVVEITDSDDTEDVVKIADPDLMKPLNTLDRPYCTPKQIANVANVSTATVMRWIGKDTFSVVRIRNSYRIDTESFVEWYRQQKL